MSPFSLSLFLQGCTNARPIQTFKVVESNPREELEDESYRFRRISSDNSAFLTVKRLNGQISKKDKVLVRFKSQDFEPGYEHAADWRGASIGKGWWSSDIPMTSYVDSSTQMQTVQSLAKEPICKAKKSQAEYLTTMCALHGDPSEKELFPVYDGANRLGKWNDCELDRGPRCSFEGEQYTSCSLGSWLSPGVEDMTIKEKTHRHLDGAYKETNGNYGETIRQNERLTTLDRAKAFYNLDNKNNRHSQHEIFDHRDCGYRHFIPIKFSTGECAQPRLALVNAPKKYGMKHTIEEICTADEAQATGSTTSMKVHSDLYYIEILFKQGHKENCLSRDNQPDWFCQPSEAEVDSAFDNGWSMLPFSFFGDKEEEDYTSTNTNGNLAFGMRLWVRFDDRIDEGNPPPGAKSDRDYLKGIADKSCN